MQIDYKETVSFIFINCDDFVLRKLRFFDWLVMMNTDFISVDIQAGFYDPRSELMVAVILQLCFVLFLQDYNPKVERVFSMLRRSNRFSCSAKAVYLYTT